ncbi:NADH dehydrogenase subunit 2, partial (mitochondrion) [Neolecta irregularis DAH-3]
MYSSLSNTGFILIGISLMSAFSISSSIFYLIHYSIVNLTIFLALISLGYLYPKDFRSC